MANNTTHLEEWVDEHLATLAAADLWEPNINAGIARLRAQRAAARRRPTAWIWATAVSGFAALLCLIALPTPRALAQRCLNCSVALLQGLAAPGPGHANLTPANARKLAPDFTLNDAGGHPIRLSALRGKVVLLNFWATWCHGCKTEIPWFMDFQSAYQKRDFVVLGASMDDDGWKSVRPYLAQKPVNYPIVVGDAALAAKYGADKGLPTTVLIDKSGRIAATHAGVVSRRDCQAEIEALL